MAGMLPPADADEECAEPAEPPDEEEGAGGGGDVAFWWLREAEEPMAAPGSDTVDGEDVGWKLLVAADAAGGCRTPIAGAVCFRRAVTTVLTAFALIAIRLAAPDADHCTMYAWNRDGMGCEAHANRECSRDMTRSNR